jgi:glucose-1-phosphate cytidylyltransferase
MKVVILAGGVGSRLSEETDKIPKPLVEVGGKPILWHIMKIYSSHNINEFIICCGYKGHLIKEYFANYSLHQSDVTFNLVDNSVSIHQNKTEPWKVTLVNTGQNTMTGSRLKLVKSYIKDEEDFCFTYGDGVADINITKLLKFHQNHGKQATLTAVRPPGRYGALKLASNDKVINFKEKPEGDESWINGGFFILKPDVIDLIKDNNVSWELNPLNELAINNQLYAFKHHGFWQPMDTLREKNLLNDLWNKNNAPWKIWE